MRQDTNEMAQEHVLRSTTFEYLLRAADACCTDEGTRREETYRDKEGENKKSRKQGTKKARKSYIKTSIVTKFLVSATKPSREPCHTICHLLPALVSNGIKCHYCRCRASPPWTNQRKPNYIYIPVHTPKCSAVLVGTRRYGSITWSIRNRPAKKKNLPV